jgi:hypothetical protein
MPPCKNAASSSSERILNRKPRNQRCSRRGRSCGSGRALESRQPTRRTNFCGADWLPRPMSPHCCAIATELLGCSVLGGFCLSIRGLSEEPSPKASTTGWPGLRTSLSLPTSMLPLPTTAIPCWRYDTTQRTTAWKGCEAVGVSRTRRRLGSHWLRRKQEFSIRERLKSRTEPAICDCLALRFGLSRRTEIIGLFGILFRPAAATKPFSRATKPFPALDVDVRKPGLVIQPHTCRIPLRRWTIAQ